MLGDSHMRLENLQDFEVENCGFLDKRKTKLRT